VKDGLVHLLSPNRDRIIQTGHVLIIRTDNLLLTRQIKILGKNRICG